MPRPSVVSRQSYTNSNRPASLTVTIRAYELFRRPTHRRHFQSDEEYSAYLKAREIYQDASGTAEWEYPRPVDLWSAADVDAVVMRALDVMASLPVADEDAPRYTPLRTGAGCVEFEYAANKRTGAYTTLSVTALRKPYQATIRIDGAVPPRALTLLLEQHGRGRGQFRLEMEANLGYLPSFHLADEIAIRSVEAAR